MYLKKGREILSACSANLEESNQILIFGAPKNQVEDFQGFMWILEYY
jgi:hypothetical protein